MSERRAAHHAAYQTKRTGRAGPCAPGTAQTAWVFLALGLLFTVNGLLVCIGWALAAAWAARRAGALQRATRWLDGVAGGLFIAFGIKLALTDVPGGS